MLEKHYQLYNLHKSVTTTVVYHDGLSAVIKIRKLTSNEILITSNGTIVMKNISVSLIINKDKYIYNDRQQLSSFNQLLKGL